MRGLLVMALLLAACSTTAEEPIESSTAGESGTTSTTVTATSATTRAPTTTSTTTSTTAASTTTATTASSTTSTTAATSTTAGTTSTTTAPSTTTTSTVATTTTSPTTTAPGGASLDIDIENFQFMGAASGRVGDTVEVRNRDGVSHTWTAVDGAFNSGVLSPDSRFEFTFDQPGTFAFFCQIHPSMQGSITISS